MNLIRHFEVIDRNAPGGRGRSTVHLSISRGEMAALLSHPDKALLEDFPTAQIVITVQNEVPNGQQTPHVDPTA